jgi:hypothetical protein
MMEILQWWMGLYFRELTSCNVEERRCICFQVPLICDALASRYSCHFVILKVQVSIVE